VQIKLPAHLLQKRDDLAWLHVGLGMAVVALAGVAAFWIGHWAAYVVAYILVGAYGQSLYILQHETMHRLLFRSAALNDWVGRFLSAFLGTQFFFGRTVHMQHHRAVGSPDDPNEAFHNTRGKEPALKFLRFLAFHCFGGRLLAVGQGVARAALGVLGLGGLAARLPEGPQSSKIPVAADLQRKDFIWLIAIQVGILAYFTLASSWWVYFAFYLAPLATLTTLFEAIRSFSEHVLPGGEPQNDAEQNRRFFMNGPAIERFFISQHDFHFHHVHHLYPTVPTFNVRAAHVWLVENDPDFAGRYIERPGYVGTAWLYLARRPVPGQGSSIMGTSS